MGWQCDLGRQVGGRRRPEIRSIASVVLVHAAVWVTWSATPALAQHDPAAGKVTLRGQVFQIYPAEKLAAKGMDTPTIPDGQNAAWVYVDAINALVDVPKDLQEAFDEATTSGMWPQGETGQKLSAWLDENGPALELVRKASTMPAYHMPLFRGDSDSLIAALLPTLGHQRQIARLLTLDAARATAEGRADAAMDNALTLQRMANQTGRGNTLIEGLVGVAIGGLAQQTAQRTAATDAVSAEKLTAVGIEMDRLAADQPDWEAMMRAEQRWGGSYVDDVMDSDSLVPMMLDESGMFGVTPIGNPNGWQRLKTRLKRLYYPDRQMKQHHRAYFERMIAAARHEDGSVGLDKTEEEILATVPRWNLIGRMMLPAVSRTHETTLMSRSNFQRARIATAVAAYKKTTGRYPASIGELTPKFLPSLPVDAMTGHAFEIAPAPDGKGVTGIERLSRENEASVRAKRRTPDRVSAAVRAGVWREMAGEYAERYRFDAAQKAAAEAIVRDLESRAAGKTPSGEKTITALTEELKRRLENLPTAEQKAGVGKEK